MKIEDKGVILSIKNISEDALLVRCFTQKYGLLSGYYKQSLNGRSNNDSRKTTLVNGAVVNLSWYSRVSEQLGKYKNIENANNEHLKIIYNKNQGIFLNGVLCLLSETLNEKEPNNTMWESLMVFMQAIGNDDDVIYAAFMYLMFELNVLKISGYGLNLNVCIATGDTQNLVYISPKSGWSVSLEAGLPYHDKLFRLPNIMRSMEEKIAQYKEYRQISDLEIDDILEGLKITKFFIEKSIMQKTPFVRELIVKAIKK